MLLEIMKRNKIVDDGRAAVRRAMQMASWNVDDDYDDEEYAIPFEAESQEEMSTIAPGSPTSSVVSIESRSRRGVPIEDDTYVDRLEQVSPFINDAVTMIPSPIDCDLSYFPSSDHAGWRKKKRSLG